MKILAFAGSLRKQSYNRALLRIAQSVLPPNVEYEIFDLAQLPIFNEDLRQTTGVPEAVQLFNDKVMAADALLIALPEYDNFMPGVLKMALEWLSDDANIDRPLRGKPVAVMSASTTGFGGTRAQIQMKAMSYPLKIHLLNNFSVTVSKARDKFDKNGNLLDEHIKEKIQKLLVDLIAWTEKMSTK